MNDMNRIKVVLVEKKKTSKWLAEVLGKNPATISKWCTNTSQPDVATLREIARVLDIDVKELLKLYKIVLYLHMIAIYYGKKEK